MKLPALLYREKKKGGGAGIIKEDIKEQPSSRNLSATATRVLQCTRTGPVADSQKYFSAIHTSPQLTSHLLLLTI